MNELEKLYLEKCNELKITKTLFRKLFKLLIDLAHLMAKPLTHHA